MDFFLPVCLLLCIVSCMARPDGAPRSACSSLTPSHSGIASQRNTPPYTVSAVKSGNKIRVTISSPIGEEFEGFILQARSNRDKNLMIEGKFTSSDTAKTIDCFRGKQNTLTQRNPNPKTVVNTEWTPSGDVNEDIIFRATVAKTYALFWTGIDSNPIRVKSDGDMPIAEKESSSHSIYDDCFTSKGCFGIPSGCAARTDCEILLSYAKTANGIRFNLHGYLEPEVYMAMALSTDSQMGDDAVTECFRQGSDVIARESWNEGKSNTRTRELQRNRYSSSFSNGLATCTWVAPYLTENNGRRYNLANNTYYLLLATGPVNNGRLRYHDGRLASQERINFTSFEAVEGEGVTDSVKIHGITEESTELMYNTATDEREAKPTQYPIETETSEIAETSETSDSLNLSSQLQISHLLLFALFGLSFAIGRNSF